MKNRKNNDDARDTFPKVGDDEAEVVNASGQPSPNTKRVSRGRSITPPPGRALPHRRQMMINAESGQRLDTHAERALSQAAGKLSIAETVDQVPAGRETLRHIFGVTVRRDRA